MSTRDAFRLAFDAGSDPHDRAVILTATVTVDGQTFTAQDQVDRVAWEHIAADPPLRTHIEQRLRHRLAEALVERLDPPVTVHVPVSCAEALSAALARADAGMSGAPGPHACQPFELGSEV
ncbi:hypothetical protein ACFQ6U_14040 [Streptomyces sp. NPDC056465]|uniref:hypothetical protein n=1 Tax=unclassified Streptomyces TaxID=2593676 RepID=UPI0035DEAA5C